MRDIIIIAVSILLVCFTSNFNNCYKIDGVVKKVHINEITVLDSCGKSWPFTGHGYTVGQKVIIKFNTNGTKTERLDDEIIDIITQKKE